MQNDFITIVSTILDPDLPDVPPEDPEGEPSAPCPVIKITTDITHVVDQAQEALLHLPNAPVLFQRGHVLCSIARGVPPPKWLHRAPDAPIIQTLKPARLLELMSRAASWERYEKRAKKGEEWQPALPPHWAVETLHARPAWPFPVLEGLITTPTLRPDGSLLATPGYDPDTGLYLDTQGTPFRPLLPKPTRDDAIRAVQAFTGVLQDFRFVGTGFEAAVAGVCTLVCRPTVQGNVPLFAVRSTVRGSGKGLLIDTLSIIGTGRPAPHWPQSDNDEEDRKRLVTVGLSGDACIHIDNVKYPLGSPALDLALTTSAITDRLLGFNQQVTAPLNMVWFASGNNMQFRGDTARRVVPIDLDPELECPEERTGFAYPALLAHVREARPALVWAALTLVQAYMGQGCEPQGLSAYGSFQEWSDLIRAAVVWATGEDPCEGRKDLEAQSDPAYERITTLLRCWEACYGTAFAAITSAVETITKELPREETRERTTSPDDFTPNPEVHKWVDLQQALSNFDSTWRGQGKLNAKAIGNALPAIKGRVIGKKRFERSETRYNDGYRWSVSSVSSVSLQHPHAESGKLPYSGHRLLNDTLDTLDTRTAPDSERPPGASPTTNGSVFGGSDISPRASLPDEAGEVLSRARASEPESEAPERPLTGSPTRISSPSPGGNGAASAGALACRHEHWTREPDTQTMRCLRLTCGARALVPRCPQCGTWTVDYEENTQIMHCPTPAHAHTDVPVRWQAGVVSEMVHP